MLRRGRSVARFFQHLEALISASGRFNTLTFGAPLVLGKVGICITMAQLLP